MLTTCSINSPGGYPYNGDVPKRYYSSSFIPVRMQHSGTLRQPLRRVQWNLLPLIVAVCGWCATLLLCRVMLLRESTQVAQTAALASRGIQSKVTSSISAQVAPLEALVARWGADSDPWQPEWESEAGQLRQRYPALEFINWVDASYAVRWAAPPAELHVESLRYGIDTARNGRKTTIMLSPGV